jgi:hypothetical protein
MHPNRSTHLRTVPRVCGQCGVAFLAEQSNVNRGIARFCSRKCLGASQRKARTNCPLCGKPTPRAGMKYCSPACYRSAPLATTAERFWRYVEKSEGCWLWTGGRLMKGYGTLGGTREEGAPQDRLAHRVSWELHHGTPPPHDRMVCHTCDNPPCVNPAHLFLGDARSNAADMVAKGRANQGKKLTAADVRTIRANYVPVRGALTALAARFGVDRRSIAEVVHGRTWKHIT